MTPLVGLVRQARINPSVLRSDGSIGTMLSRLILCALIIINVVPAEERDRDQPYQGMDLIGAAKTVKEAISPTVPEISKGKPWENDIAALTSSDSHRYNPAISKLILRGPAVLPDLLVLAEDRDWQVRQRVTRIAGYIGGDASAALVLAKTYDSVLQVCVEATVALGQVKGAAAFPRLEELLQAPEPDVRRAAAAGMGLLGDIRGLDALMVVVHETDDLAKRDMRTALARIALQPSAIPELAKRIAAYHGAEQKMCIEISGQIGDPRLCPVLTSLLTSSDIDVASRAARSLAANGDSRALSALCAIADAHPVPTLQMLATETLRRLTGYEAAPGSAWRLWWQQHSVEVDRLVLRDALIASLYDPAYQTTKEELAVFSVVELTPLLEGALGNGPSWWPARAFHAMATDVPGRWTEALAARIRVTRIASQRLPLLLILDQLGDPGAAAIFHELLDQKDELLRPIGSELIAINVALERRK